MGVLDSLFGWGGEDPNAIRQREEGYRRQAEERAAAAAKAQQDAQLAYLEQIRQDDLRKEAELKAKDPTDTRNAALAQINAAFAPDYENTYLPGTLTDPLETETYGREFQKVQDAVDRMFNRGVITEEGRQAALKRVSEDQAPRVRQQLNDIGDVILNAEREKLGGFAGRAKQRAGELNVGEGFDVTPYTTGLQGEIGTFNKGLSDLYRSQVPTDLFDLSSLGSIAGQAQGAGNRPFEPDINADLFTQTKTDETDPYASTTKKRTATVF